MSDPAIVLIRLLLLLFVPAMLLFSVLFVHCTPNRAASDADRATAAARLMALWIATLVALVIWGACVLSPRSLGIPALSWAGYASALLFFPLWFAFAMPALRMRSPAWAGPHAVGSPTRTASLVNRSRENPIGIGHWIAVVALGALLLGTILARGWARPFDGPSEQLRWMIISIVYALTLLVALGFQPVAIRQALREPEPLDASGSEELRRMYDAARTSRIRTMFWLVGAALPLLLGALLALSVWLDRPWAIGVVGAVGGTLLGLLGAWFGVRASLRRVRIAETRARLEGS
ncbi:MAG TPA: hypothetical protein PKC43_00290 [Phycisphaerales bacterium]|nr:hypothetical protein [Phycisphaerales bacterium]HMP35863.1 hypothetical protein [Phycisphaerales bacterium]